MERAYREPNTKTLCRGVLYAIRANSGLDLQAGMYLGQVWKRLRDGRVVQARAWALPSEDGWWRPNWAWGLKSTWADFLALPEAERPL